MCGILVARSGGLSAQPAAQAPPAPTPQQRVEMLQQWLKASQAQMRSYQWIETTVVSKDGEQKSRTQKTCYYGADGALQKVPVADDASTQDSGRDPILGRRLRESAKKDATEYMQDAAALVHSYIPPDPARIQQVVGAGKFSVNVVNPGSSVALQFKDYLKPGDQLSVTVDLPTNRLLGIDVASYLDSPQDAVQLDVAMGVLPDGTIYAARSVLDAKAKDITVTVENSGYRKIN